MLCCAEGEWALPVAAINPPRTYFSPSTHSCCTLTHSYAGTLVGPSEFPVFVPDVAGLYPNRSPDMRATNKGFYEVLSERVRAYFAESKQNPKNVLPGALRLLVQMAIGFTCFAISIGVLLPGTGFAWRCVAAAIYGVFQVMPLLHAMHDASHTAIGSSESYWKFFGRITMDWYAGSSMISWHHQHIVGHHVYTNVFLADPDIPYR